MPEASLSLAEVLLRNTGFLASLQFSPAAAGRAAVRVFDQVALLCYSDPMVKSLTLRRVGGSVSATLPKDMADRLHLEPGDSVLAIETDRGVLLTPYDPETERALEAAARAAKKYRNVLRQLAK